MQYEALLPTSSPSSSRSQSVSHGIQIRFPRPFRHCFQSQARPIPHLLHPDVEGPTEEPDAPYTITFRERQYISAEGASEGPRWTTLLMYIFHEKKDQITFCESIFSKTLVMSAHINKITYNGQEISHMSAIALWFDGASELQSTTFFPNPTGKKATPKDMELKFHGLWDANEALRKQNAIAVVAKSMLRVDEGLNTFAGLDRQSSVNPDGTFPAKRLRLSRKSGSSLKS